VCGLTAIAPYKLCSAQFSVWRGDFVSLSWPSFKHSHWNGVSNFLKSRSHLSQNKRQ
jgi:hypothetical protein